MKNRTTLFFLFGALAAAVIITVLYSGSRLFNPAPVAQKKAIVIFKTIDYGATPFWGIVRDGAESGGKDFNISVSFRGPPNEKDVQGQIAIVRQALEEKPDAIVLAASDFNLLVPLAKEIKARRIPLVCVDSFINSDDADVRVGTDSYEGGQKCGTALMRYIKNGETVAVMSYVKGSSTAIDRESGVRDYLNDRVKILDTLYSESDAHTAYVQATILISRTPNLRGIVALNDPTAQGAAKALAESGKAEKIMLVGFDNSFPVMKYTERGIIKDAIVQKPFNMGYLAVQAARELMDGKRPARYINTGSVDVTSGNMFKPENQKLLFPVSSSAR
jgi:ribose transport system substrate-binding protein